MKPEDFNNAEGITKRGVIDIGRVCGLDCLFCYHRWDNRRLRDYLSFFDIKQRLLKFRNLLELDCVDYTGGEPTTHPNVVDIVQFGTDLGLRTCLITHGLALTDKKLVKLKDAGLHEFLISIHGYGEAHDFLVNKQGAFAKVGRALERLQEHGIPYRVNTVITAQGHQSYPALAEWLLSRPNPPGNHNFLCFNPWSDWALKSDIDIQVRHSEAAPQVQQCIDLYEARGIHTTVRYAPFCLYRGYEKHVTCFPQIIYDPLEWDVRAYSNMQAEKVLPMLQGFLQQGVYGRTPAHVFFNGWMKNNQRNLCVTPGECLQCRNLQVCDRLSEQYYRRYGDEELVPEGGDLVREPDYYLRNGNGGVPA